MSDEVKPEVIQKTQKLLGKYIKKPPLSDKLLKKPPFRFLHDVVVAVIKQTGFLKGLYTAEELQSDNVKERDAKIAFLNKLIGAVKTITKIDLKVRSTKIVAGLEPTETNILLQTIAKALDDKLDSREYVHSYAKELNGVIEKKTSSRENANKTKDSAVTKPEEKRKSSLDKKAETQSSTDRKSKDRNLKKDDKRSKDSNHKTDKTAKSKKDSSRSRREQKESIRKEQLNKELQELLIVNDKEANEVKKSAEDTNEEKAPTEASTPAEESNEIKSEASAAKPDEEKIQNEEEKQIERRPSALKRPKSARPKSGEFREKTTSEITEAAPIEKEPTAQSEIPKRPKSSLRPPSVRPSSARPGAPRLRPDSAIKPQETMTMGKINVIVENYDKDADDEETVVIQTAPEIIESHSLTPEVPETNKGQLVEQILEQINEDEPPPKPKVEINWEQDGFRDKNSITKEINNLQTLIQNLTKSANPLGKLLNYLHEDMEAMYNELQQWSNSKKQLFLEIAKQKRVTSEQNKPLLVQLEALNQEIRKQEQEIIYIRSNILRNDVTIKELMTK